MSPWRGLKPTPPCADTKDVCLRCDVISVFPWQRDGITNAASTFSDSNTNVWGVNYSNGARKAGGGLPSPAHADGASWRLSFLQTCKIYTKTKRNTTSTSLFGAKHCPLWWSQWFVALNQHFFFTPPNWVLSSLFINNTFKSLCNRFYYKMISLTALLLENILLTEFELLFSPHLCCIMCGGAFTR